MDIQSIVSELRGQVERLNTAIAALEGTHGSTTVKRKGPKPGRRMSAAGRARISAGMKKRWAQRKRKRAAKASA
jgi:hypothetical protein